MKRDATLWIHFVLDELLPPILRDASWFYKPLLRLALGRRAELFYDFKDEVNDMAPAEFADRYARTAGLLERATDLNDRCVDRILGSIDAGPVLEVGCGRGYLAGLLAERWRVTAIDIHVGQTMVQAYPNVGFLEADAEALPFADDCFPTVVCTHTLEHVRDLPAAVAELRRVCRDQLVVVVPKQRPYRYTFDLHVNFFPYPHSLVNALRPPPKSYACAVVGGDLLYSERLASSTGGSPAELEGRSPHRVPSPAG